MGNENLEKLLDAIAEALIESPLVSAGDVELNQKYIRNGTLQQGMGEVDENSTLALFQKDVEANIEDLALQEYANQITNFNTLQVNISGGDEDGDNSVAITIIGSGLPPNGYNITDIVFGDGNPLNVSQFISVSKRQTIVDADKANEYLDTNIFELLPPSDERQERIINFFNEMNALLPPTISDGTWDNNPQDGRVDRNDDGTWIGAEQYSRENSISYTQDNFDGINEDDAFIHRLKSTANDTNSTLTIQDIYNRVVPYLRDILEPITELEDMPEYENQSSGYLQFRNPNQGIIIRNDNQEFVQGLDPNNPTWLSSNYPAVLSTLGTDQEPFNQTHAAILATAGTGFTITMWVKFLDKASEGTLFNFGNPTKSENPFGFRLETFVLNQDDTVEEYLEGGGGPIYTFRQYINGQVPTFTDAENQVCQEYFANNTNLFKTTNTERFVRLQVREFGDFKTSDDFGLRDSHLGNPTKHGNKLRNNPPDLNFSPNNTGARFSADEIRILNYTNIPEDFNEWYFICATYNPSISEYNSPTSNAIGETPDFWLNHINKQSGAYEANSGHGNKCKVEIISRSDLLRARGFKV